MITHMLSLFPSSSLAPTSNSSSRPRGHAAKTKTKDKKIGLIDDLSEFGHPSTPPEPAPLDPTNSFRDPRANLVHQQQKRYSSSDRAKGQGQGQVRRLVKASTMPSEVGEAGRGSHTSLEDDGEEGQMGIATKAPGRRIRSGRKKKRKLSGVSSERQ